MTVRGKLLYRSRRRILSGFIVIWIAAFVATHIPGENLPEIPTSDRVLHTIAFFILTGAMLLTMIAHMSKRKYRIPFIICVMVIYAALDELTQPLVGRYNSVDDWLADVIGVLIAIITGELFWMWLTRRTKKATT